MTPDTQQILAFLAVADAGSFSGAAQRLNLTQPAISKRVRGLEEVMGRALFDRIGRQVNLTEAGQALLPVARRIRRDLEDAHRAVSDLGGPVGGRLALVTSHHIGLHLLPGILRRYVRRHPAVEPDLAFMDSEDAFRAVERGEYELAIVTLPDHHPAELSVRTLWQDPLHIVVAPEHPLAAGAPPSPELLTHHRAILPAHHTVTRQRLERWLMAQNAGCGEVMEVNYLQTIHTLVGVGLGWSALPGPLCGPELTRLEFGTPPPFRRLGLARHRDRSPTRASLALEALLPESGADVSSNGNLD